MVSRLASPVPDSPTQTVATDGVDAWGAPLLPEKMLHGTSIDPDVSHLPPDEVVGSQGTAPRAGPAPGALVAILRSRSLARRGHAHRTASTKTNTDDSVAATSTGAKRIARPRLSHPSRRR